MRKATIAPRFICPSEILVDPNHTTATHEMLTIIVAVGNIRLMSRPPRNAVAVTSMFPALNRSISSGSRTKARTTRIPESCSRRTSLMRSIRCCIKRKVGTILTTTVPRIAATRGTETTMIHDRATSCFRAKINPPIAVKGAANNSVQVIKTNICTCVTSLVMRVINEGEPKCATSRDEKLLT